ncbi:MAG: ABC transporter permease [Clostridia bacterium]|nr:ABC transporter permease [Clostridia bacterium]
MAKSALRRGIWLLLILPGVIFVTVFMLIPLFSILMSTFFADGGFSLDNYGKLIQSVYFQQVFGRSVRLSLLSTVLCAALGFPCAYYISRYSKRKGMMMALAVFPMFTSPVIRSFSWMVILGRKGIVNQFLVNIGLFSRPQSLLYNEFSMTVGFVQLFLPQMILSLLGVMDSIPEDLTEAAGSLGAPRFVAFLRIVFPLSVSGLVTGAVLVFTGCMTAYTTPQLLGATDTQVLSTMVYQYAMSLRDWTQASAVAMVMIVVTMLVSGVFNRLSKKINPMAA